MLKNEMQTYVIVGGGALKILRTLTWGKGGSKIAKIILA